MKPVAFNLREFDSSITLILETFFIDTLLSDSEFSETLDNGQ